MASRSNKGSRIGLTRMPRRRVAIGPPRPRYLLNEENDRMMMIITALAAEVSALRERLDTHESLAEQRRFATKKAIEGFTLSAARRTLREQGRQEMLARVFRVLMEDLDQARSSHAEAAQGILSEETAD